MNGSVGQFLSQINSNCQVNQPAHKTEGVNRIQTMRFGGEYYVLKRSTIRCFIQYFLSGEGTG